mmetsp:Transcript_18378/g.50432  ORF Transcript_18378/g.50432 Transcript_18378/m.50432 type:complete len:136 (-) Transcript_18378:53-460(-)
MATALLAGAVLRGGRSLARNSAMGPPAPLAALAPLHAFIREDRRFYRHRGVLKLHCAECRYVIRKWHVPILAVDCNANPRHKQALTNTVPHSRYMAQFPNHLAPWVEGKQYPRHPRYKMDHTFQYLHKTKGLKLR